MLEVIKKIYNNFSGYRLTCTRLTLVLVLYQPVKDKQVLNTFP